MYCALVLAGRALPPGTTQFGNPVPTKCTEHRGIKPKAPVQSGNQANPKLELEAVATDPVHAGNLCPLPQCLLGTTLRPGACWGCAALPPHRLALFVPQGSKRGRSPGQPAACGGAGALLLFTHSLLRPRGRHRDYSLHAPQCTADELGPGPSPESRPGGPAAGHAGIWSPPPARLLVSSSGAELPAPQLSAWLARAPAPPSGRSGPSAEAPQPTSGVCFLRSSRLPPCARPPPRPRPWACALAG